MKQNYYIRIVYLTVLMTGLFSLVYQVIWQRYLTFVVGSDSGASTLILTMFLAALSVGYWVAGHWSKRLLNKEIYYYGLVEILIGIWAVFFPWFFKLSFLMLEIKFPYDFLSDFLITFCLIVPPAILMGVTLPFLTQGLSQSFASASKTHANIYAINTIGACIGSLLAGFVLLEMLGLSMTSYLLGGINICLGILMIYLGKKIKPIGYIPQFSKNKELTTSGSTGLKLNNTFILLVAACSGYLLIALETYFIRLFSIATDGSNHAYPTIVSAFIAAVGLGAGLAGKYLNHAHKLFVRVPILVTLAWVIIFYSLPYWPYFDYLIKQFWLSQLNGSLWMLPILRFLAVLAIIIIPVSTASMLLPFSFHFFKDKKTTLGKTTGNLYAVATTATILGGFVGGYLLFKIFDFSEIYVSYLVVLVFMSLFAQLAVRGVVSVAWNGVLIILIVITAFNLPQHLNRNLALTFYFQNSPEIMNHHKDMDSATAWLWQWFNQDEILNSSVQPEGKVDVFINHASDQRMITINGRSNSGTDIKELTGNGLLGLMPYLVTENPQEILIIGLGTGVTAGLLAEQELVKRVDVCEINLSVIDQLSYFDSFTANASQNNKINLIHSDVIKHLQKHDKKYDMVISIPSNFWVAGVENLLTPEFYQLVEKKLSKGGTFIQWVPDYEFSAEGLLLISRAFSTVFESPTLWRLTPYDLALVYQQDHVIDVEQPWVQARKQDKVLRQTLRNIGVFNIRKLLRSQLSDSATIIKASEYGSLHNIDYPQLGRTALKALYAPETDYDPVKILNESAQKKSAK